MTLTEVEDRLDLPVLYPKQQELMDSPAKRKVMCAGRRAGKSVAAGRYGLREFLLGKRVLFSSTSQDQADIFWEYLTNWCAPLFNEPGFYKNEAKRIMRWRGGHIRVKTGSNADALRGGWAHLLILDECAYLDPRAWYDVGAPMLADKDGTVVFISTPRLKNWFYDLFMKAEGLKEGGLDADEDGARWETWHFTTLENPYLNTRALKALTEDMTEDSYKQEILAVFMDDAGAVFRDIHKCVRKIPIIPVTGRFVAGVDVGMVNDFTVMIVMDAITGTMVDMIRFKGTSWEEAADNIAKCFWKWKIANLIVESNVATALIELLQKRGVAVTGFQTTSSSKPPMIQSLQVAFEKGEISILNNGILIAELMSYQSEPSARGIKYNAPVGQHDDCVIALALTVLARSGYGGWIGKWDGKIGRRR